MTLKVNEYIGFDIGGTNYKAGTLRIRQDTQHISSKLINIEYRDSKAEEGFDISYGNLLDFIISYIKGRGDRTIGLGFPSVVTSSGEIPIAPNMLGWKNIPLKTRLTTDLSQALGYHIDIVVENDANVAAFAEMQIGNASGFRSFIYITLGTGIGGSIIYERQILKGSTFSAGEIGHTIIDRNANILPEQSYRTGVFESYAGKKAILKSYLSLVGNQGTNDSDNIEVKDIFDRSVNGDKLALKVVETYISDMSVGLASAINLLGIPILIIGGGISKSLIDYWDKLEDAVRERLLPGNRKQFKLIHAYFQKDSGLIGSALMAKHFEENNN